MAMHTESSMPLLFDPHIYERLVQAYHRIDQRDVLQAWHLLEALHVFGQTRLLPHAHTHWLMLGLAWRTRNLAEWRGQILRLLLVPLGHLLTRLPLGNNGRAHVSAFQPMAVTPELMATIRQFQQPNPRTS
ncbi:MAG: DUF3703 domain-containing protein [Rhodoferax sp.]|uniref:DUF3703 domain-containing protein n=1 Tax=Rhodoferax sp. TaxID=50421 RepID=UPI002ACD7FB3|nr:DUF3703 domain-containing protein [Rhodoferax sp.]MDZ7892769.1 DUF3703 domain-containing protein [Rhodoferax sp.]